MDPEYDDDLERTQPMPVLEESFEPSRHLKQEIPHVVRGDADFTRNIQHLEQFLRFELHTRR